MRIRQVRYYSEPIRKVSRGAVALETRRVWRVVHDNIQTETTEGTRLDET